MKIKAPAHLGAAGRSLWRKITEPYELRPDELLILEQACRELDLIGRLEASIPELTILTTGSTGQLVVHPAVSELRQHRAVLRGLLASLKLPDDAGSESGGSSESGGELSAKNRSAAQARWSRRGA